MVWLKVQEFLESIYIVKAGVCLSIRLRALILSITVWSQFMEKIPQIQISLL